MCRESFDWLKMAAELESDIARLEKRVAELQEEAKCDLAVNSQKCGYEEILLELKTQRNFLLKKAKERSGL